MKYQATLKGEEKGESFWVDPSTLDIMILRYLIENPDGKTPEEMTDSLAGRNFWIAETYHAGKRPVSSVLVSEELAKMERRGWITRV